MSSTEERAGWLKKTPLFAKLHEDECRMLAPVFKERSLKADEYLFRQGEPGDYLAVVVRGELVIEVQRDREQTVVSRRGPYGTVGEMSSLDPAPRSATVRASEATQVLVLTRNMLDSLKVNAPGLFSRVVQGVARRMAGLLDETNELISGLLQVKRAPTQPRQPSLQAMQEGSKKRGKPVREQVKLEPRGALRGLTERDREVLRSVSTARRFDGGEVICLEGEMAKAAYLVAEGDVDVLRTVSGKTYRLATVSQGALLGQRALLREGLRSATLRARPPGAVLLGLARDRFDALLEAESPLAIEFQELVTVSGIRQLRQANVMAAYLGEREEKRQVPERSQVRQRVQEMIDAELDEAEDVESLAAAYLETSLQDWEVTPSDLQNIRVARPSGEMSAAEKKMRQKFNK